MRSNVFGKFDHIIKNYNIDEVLNNSEKLYFGVDIANGSGGDYSVITAFNENGVLAYFKRFNNVSQTEQVNILAKTYNDFKQRINRFNVESNNMGSTFIDLLRSNGCYPDSFTTTAKTKRGLIDDFIVSVEKGKITLPDDDAIINELQDFQVNHKPDGGVSFGSSTGKHDDIVMSLMLAWAGFKKYDYQYDPNNINNDIPILIKLR